MGEDIEGGRGCGGGGGGGGWRGEAARVPYKCNRCAGCQCSAHSPRLLVSIPGIREIINFL